LRKRSNIATSPSPPSRRVAVGGEFTIENLDTKHGVATFQVSRFWALAYLTFLAIALS
jgi:hypothetical protein